MEVVALAVLGLAVLAVAARQAWLAVQHHDQVKVVRRPRDARAFVFGDRLQQRRPAVDFPPKPSNRGRLLRPRTAHEQNPGVGDGVTPMASSAAMLDAVAQGTWAGATVLHDFAQVDDSVYEAMSQLAGQQLDSIADLNGYLDAKWDSASLGESLPEGALRKLMGHLAEPMVKDHLEDHGIRVAMPEDSNQAGWDLILNGEHNVNVKTMSDFSSLAHHFDKYPDIPVVVPGDMAGIPGDAIWLDHADAMDALGDRVAAGHEHIVLVDPDLSHADAMDHADAVGDAAMGHVDLAAGIPVFTAVMCGIREFQLLKKDDTDMGHALKHIGLDVGGTGLGGLGGAKAGAAIGTMIAPGVGTAIGGVIGSIAGALFGRKLTNSIKEAPFDEALATYRATSDDAKRRAGEVEASAKAAYDRKVREERTCLGDVAREAKEAIRARRAQAKRVLDQGYSIPRAEAEALLDQARGELRSHADHLRGKLALVPWHRRILWPDAATVVLWGSIRELVALESHLVATATAILSASSANLDGDLSLGFFQALLAVDTASAKISAFVARCESHRRHAEEELRNEIGRARERMMAARTTAMRSIAGEVTKLRLECQAKLTPLVEQVRVAGDAVRVEAKRLGRTV